MNITTAGSTVRGRKIDFDLFLSSLSLSIRSRSGFKIFMALARLAGVFGVWIRFYVNPSNKYEKVEIFLIALGLVYALGILFFSKQIIARFDTPKFHAFLIFADTVYVGCCIFVSAHLETDLYLLFFLPLITGSHFIERKRLLLIGNFIVFFYLLVLYGMFHVGVEPNKEFLKDVLAPWFGKASFLMIATLAFRAQRSLPVAKDAWVVAPAKAREKLEQMLVDFKMVVRYDTISVQLLYGNRLMIVSCNGFPNPEEIRQIEFPVDDARYPNGLVLATEKAQVVSAEKYPSFQNAHYCAGHVKTWMGIPLISMATGECFGMVSFDSGEENAYNAWDTIQATLFARKISSFLTEVALGPAALTMATNRENLLGLLKSWANLLPDKTSQWDDDAQAARELAEIGQKIFRTEDFSIYFLKHRISEGAEEPFLHLITSTTIPKDKYRIYDKKVTGHRGDGLTGLSVHRNRTLNYGSAEIARSPYHSDFSPHSEFLFTKKSRQVMISPIRDSFGNAVGAIKIKNRMGSSSEQKFFPVEKNLFEIYASTVGLILETIRQRNYVRRTDEDIHGLRGIVHNAAIVPIRAIQEGLPTLEVCGEINSNLNEIVHVLDYVKMVIHKALSDSVENLHLEKKGLIHAVHHYLASLQMMMIPEIQNACNRIEINMENVEEEIPYQVQEIFFNIAREGILNIVRHSQIDEIEDGYGRVLLEKQGGIFTLSVIDNGVGFSTSEDETNQRHSFGLRDIKAQMKYQKYHSNLAAVEIHSQPGQGTMINAKWSPENSEGIASNGIL